MSQFDDKRSYRSAARRLSTLVKAAIYVVVIFPVWTVLGILIWIPYLSREIAVYFFGTLRSTLFHTKEVHYAFRLDKAVLFYVEGFKNMYDGMFSTKDEEGKVIRAPTWKQIINELVHFILFWGGIVLAVYMYPLWLSIIN